MCSGRRELQGQLDSAVDDLRQKLNAVQEVERNAVRAAMLEERARYCLFIGAIKPLIVRVVSQRFAIIYSQSLPDSNNNNKR